uniref:Uncharacterized protein n=1 Tax=Anguilla anguilla TaxID=7936 RepID=A0A0E9XE82_ANGAN
MVVTTELHLHHHKKMPIFWYLVPFHCENSGMSNTQSDWRTVPEGMSNTQSDWSIEQEE